MYTAYFDFKENPFNLTPDPKYLFLSTYHKEALEHLLYGINERKGFIAITGGIGTGKTTLCRALLSHLDVSTRTALIFNAFLSEVELLKTINREFGINTGPGIASRNDYIDALNRFLLKNFSQGGNAVLLIDEAQNLSQAALEQVRMLSNLETEKEKLLQIVLVGQLELSSLLASPALRQLNERITVRYELKSLDSKDIQGYVAHRLSVAGGGGSSLKFSEGAFKKLYGFSRGNPRRINALCDRALLIAYAKGKHTISKSMIGNAAKELGGDAGVLSKSGRRAWKNVVGFSLLFVILAALLGMAALTYKPYFLGVFSPGPKVADKRKALKTSIPSAVPVKKEASVFLDERSSLAGLFTLFNKGINAERENIEAPTPLSLVSFRVRPEFYVLFGKPFRVLASASRGSDPKGSHYLLIQKTMPGGALVIDANGKNREVSREFLFCHWGQLVSFVYPVEKKAVRLTRGMRTLEVTRVQRILVHRGYLLEETGVYDEPTRQAVMKLQQDLGLKCDGIVGPRTMSVLFQMAG